MDLKSGSELVDADNDETCNADNASSAATSDESGMAFSINSKAFTKKLFSITLFFII